MHQYFFIFSVCTPCSRLLQTCFLHVLEALLGHESIFQLGTITTLFSGHQPSASGGTEASLDCYFHTIGTDAKAAKAMSHAYALIPDFSEAYVKEQGLPDEMSSMGPKWSQVARCRAGPFINRDVNERVVRMSNALLGWKLGVYHLPHAPSDLPCIT